MGAEGRRHLTLPLLSVRSLMGNIERTCQEAQLVARFGKKTTKGLPGRLGARCGGWCRAWLSVSVLGFLVAQKRGPSLGKNSPLQGAG